MYSPEMMKMAQEQMARMSPDQMQKMQETMKNMDPSVMQQSMDAMKNMSPDQVRMAQQQMSNMSPEQINTATQSFDSSKVAEASAQLNSQSQNQAAYAYKASVTLKKEGNALIGEGKHSFALPKYNRALDNLKDIKYAGADALRLSCRLNLALCYLRLGDSPKVIEACTNILKDTGDHVKAFYRRSQAYIETGELERAVSDLERAVELAPDDETVQEACKDAKEKLKEKVETEGVDEVKEKEAAMQREEEQKAAQEEKAKREDASEEAKKLDEQMRRAAVEMKKNPDMMKGVSKQLADMSPEQLESFNKMAKDRGMGLNMTPSMAKMAAAQMENMKPGDMERMMEMQRKTPSADMDPSKAMEQMQKNPEMMKMATQMMSNMSASDLQSMSKAAGKEMTTEQAQAAAEQMKKVSPESIEKLMKVATVVQKGVGCCKKFKDWWVRNGQGALAVVVIGVVLKGMDYI